MSLVNTDRALIDAIELASIDASLGKRYKTDRLGSLFLLDQMSHFSNNPSSRESILKKNLLWYLSTILISGF